MRRRDKMLQGLEQEIRDHIESEVQENLARGMSPGDARHAAVLKFGNATLVVEDTRGVWRHLWLDEILQDIRYGLRVREKSGFHGRGGADPGARHRRQHGHLQLAERGDAAVHSGTPSRTAVLRWSAHERPQVIGHSSFADCERTNWVRSSASSCSFSYPMFQEIRDGARVFSGVGAFAGPAQLNLAGNGTASMVRGEIVSGDSFATLGVSSAVGRMLEPADEQPGAEPVAVLDYGYWQGAFGGSSNAVGKSIKLNGVPFTIVGVADSRFTRFTPGKSQELWLPLSQAVALRLPWSEEPAKSKLWWLAIVGRVAPDVSRSEAQSAATLLFRNQVIHDALLKEADDPQLALLPAQQGLVGVRGEVRGPLVILMATVGILLLISCANVAGLLLSRAAARQKEMAVRLALGTGRGRVTRQLLTESVMLSLAGAAIGVLVAFWGANALAAFVAANHSGLHINANPDLTVLLFTVGTSALSGILFGLAPAFSSTRLNVAPVLKENAGSLSGAGWGRPRKFALGSGLVVAQVALSVIVLAGAGLVVRSLANLKAIDAGFDTHNVLQFGLDPALTGYYQADQVQPLYQELQSRLSALPEVTAVTYSSGPLLDGGLWTGMSGFRGGPTSQRSRRRCWRLGLIFSRPCELR